MGTGVRRLLAVLSSIVAIAGCAAESDADAEAEPEAATADLQSAPLADGEMKKIATPAGMPKPWDQPDSTGTFDERGKCGPTATANMLKLYGVDNVSPADADRDGVHWLIGSRGINVEYYFQTKHPELGCTLEHPVDGAAFLRAQIAAHHPVMVWFNTQGFLQSHWVAVVGREGSGANEKAIVMSWGAYYTIPMARLDAAWRNVYWIQHPSVVCSKESRFVH